MKITINENDFRKAFKDANREEQFSYYALGLIFDYFTELEDATGEEVELDVILICCNFTEYSSLKDLQNSYDVPNNFAKAKEYLEDRTQVICFKEDCILIFNY